MGLIRYCFTFFNFATMLGLRSCETDDVNIHLLSRKLRYLLFPDLSTMGLYLAVATPLEDIDYHVSLAFNFEANYNLPNNYTELALPFIASNAARTKRQITRRRVYDIIEKNFRSYSFDGRECLLRTICDAAATPLNHNGILGDILHLIFTPSTSAGENLDPEYDQAEASGRNGLDCRLLYPKCRVGLLDIITRLQDSE